MLHLKSNRVKFYPGTLHNFLNTNRSRDPLTLWKAIDDALRRGVDRAKRQVGVKTGRLRNSIFAYHMGHAGGQVYGIRAVAPYATIHHEGSRPHPMEIVRVSGRSKVLVARTIMHPGTKPNPYLRNQLDTIVRVGRGPSKVYDE